MGCHVKVMTVTLEHTLEEAHKYGGRDFLDQALMQTKLGHGLDLKVPPEGSGLGNLASHCLVIVKLANLWESNEAKSIRFLLVEWHGMAVPPSSRTL